MSLVTVLIEQNELEYKMFSSSKGAVTLKLPQKENALMSKMDI